MRKRALLLVIITLFLFGTLCNAKNIKEKDKVNFKIKVISSEGNIIKVEVKTPIGEKIIITTEKDKDFKISNGNTNWYFHPVVKNSKIGFKITKKVNDKKEWKDCCAKCRGGFTACGSIGVCCQLTGNCCDAGCPCKKINR